MFRQKTALEMAASCKRVQTLKKCLLGSLLTFGLFLVCVQILYFSFSGHRFFCKNAFLDGQPLSGPFEEVFIPSSRQGSAVSVDVKITMEGLLVLW